MVWDHRANRGDFRVQNHFSLFFTFNHPLKSYCKSHTLEERLEFIWDVYQRSPSAKAAPYFLSGHFPGPAEWSYSCWQPYAPVAIVVIDDEDNLWGRTSVVGQGQRWMDRKDRTLCFGQGEKAEEEAISWQLIHSSSKQGNIHIFSRTIFTLSTMHDCSFHFPVNNIYHAWCKHNFCFSLQQHIFISFGLTRWKLLAMVLHLHMTKQSNIMSGSPLRVSKTLQICFGEVFHSSIFMVGFRQIIGVDELVGFRQDSIDASMFSPRNELVWLTRRASPCVQLHILWLVSKPSFVLEKFPGLEKE